MKYTLQKWNNSNVNTHNIDGFIQSMTSIVWLRLHVHTYLLYLYSTKPPSSTLERPMPGWCASSLLWWPTALFAQLSPHSVSPAGLLLLPVKPTLITLVSWKRRVWNVQQLSLFQNRIIQPFILFIPLIWYRAVVAAKLIGLYRPLIFVTVFHNLLEVPEVQTGQIFKPDRWSPVSASALWHLFFASIWLN